MTKCIFSTKRGKRDGNLHLQGVMLAHMATDEATMKLAREWLKTACGTHYGEGCRVAIKALTKTQSAKAMMGYVTKDQSFGHFSTYVKGITEEEIREGVREYNQVKIDPLAGRKPLNPPGTAATPWGVALAHPASGCPTIALPRWTCTEQSISAAPG